MVTTVERRVLAAEEIPDSDPTTLIPFLLSNVLKRLPTPVHNQYYLTRVISLRSSDGNLFIRQEWYTVPSGTQRGDEIKLVTLGGGGLPQIKLEFDQLRQLLEDACQKDPSSLSIRAEGNPPTTAVFSGPNGFRRVLGTWFMPAPVRR